MHLRYSIFQTSCRLASLLLLQVFLIHLPSPADAHKLRIYAWINGGKVYVESGLTGSQRLAIFHVTVKGSNSDNIITQGTPDPQGIFSFTLPPTFQENPVDMTITVSTDDGHQGEWFFTQKDFLESFESQKPRANISQDSADQMTLTNEISPILLDNIKSIIDDRLEKNLAPIHRQLAHMSEKKLSFRDIIGGIGYLIGLAGIAAWLKSRSSMETKHE